MKTAIIASAAAFAVTIAVHVLRGSLGPQAAPFLEVIVQTVGTAIAFAVLLDRVDRLTGSKPIDPQDDAAIW